MGGSTNGGRSRALRALRDSDELHRAVLANISDAVFLTDSNGQFTFICPNVDVIFGFVPDEVHEMANIEKLLGENLFDPNRLAAEGEIPNIEREITTKSGNRRTVLIQIKKVSIDVGTVLYGCRDITERKVAEAEAHSARLELNHASRLALIGELVASIVHEVKQPLTSLAANADAALVMLDQEQSLAGVPNLREILTDIHDQSLDTAAVIDRLRMMARRQSFELELLEIDEVVRGLAILIAGEARARRVRLDLKLAAEAANVRADRVCLRQVILNLLLNALDAVEQVDHERCVMVQTRRAGDTVELTVSDNGPGISSQHRAKIFDAFFTTKKTGVGLGLALSRSLAEAQGGHLALVEANDRGATFSFTLPVHVDGH
jgi:two-component system, LuxR family, sensor kinase FixL